MAPRSGINIPDHISKSLVKIFKLKILKFFVYFANPGSGAFLILDPGYGNSDAGVKKAPDPREPASGIRTNPYSHPSFEDG